ncbi:TPA: hypothetical protein R1902_000194 [Staphylococcus delphini]|nr:hypothetical protein [Staphylococcus delphini]HEC2159231.1 hypothetical protein [Staphylococcus delphini]HEC2184335.1 hypothetical protein [Staphylococcus delphini]HEC2189438.1 hypothetical protein [Staphylococcus delphini]HEC2192713.1 hypothetical protein [Staphylococcus delphini]
MIKNKTLTWKLVTEHISDGWNADLAHKLSVNFKGPGDDIQYHFKRGTEIIKVPYTKLKVLEEKGLTVFIIAQKLRRGATIEEALCADDVVLPNPKIYNDRLIREVQEASSKAAYIRYKKEKQLHQKPWLKTMQQQHKRGNYCKYLFNRSSFAKVKKDLYGRNQII